MREIKIFIVVAFIIGVMYYGVEPLAHHAMHPATAPSDYAFKDLEKLGKIDVESGDAYEGRELFANNCASCHTLSSQSEAVFNSRNPKTVQPVGEGGVVPPDLSNAGLIFDSHFLAHFIKDPVRASLLNSKFQVSCEGLDEHAMATCESSNAGKETYPMNAFNGILSDKEIADIVAFLKVIAPKQISDKEVFIESCNRCHSAIYDKNQYDSKFYAAHNAQVQPLINRAENDGEEMLIASLSEQDASFLNSLLAQAKSKEKSALTESEIDEHNDSINDKTIEHYGVLNLLRNSLLESTFNKEGLQAATDSNLIKAYLGNNPPDLSMVIRSKGTHELAAFINNPQRVPLIEIQQSIINKLVKDKREEEKAALSPNLSQKEKEALYKQIDLRDAQYYHIALPANTAKSPWQSNDDYTNMAQEMGVMPQGKSMPRVGLTKQAEAQVISYLQTIGDSKKEDRDSLGLWFIAFFVLLSALAYMWKTKIWRDLH
ncbi:ubiquinol cytochrome c oxidoreductase [Helicobacter aurati]|uniref:Ubiquinol cytochrome c oxidoreductase n=1 Tax=Helicobacter aurati TaxID=137778 RepID=A0A3D8J296_9HELI|nr:c-type cytochrome [Helicobacter aurati]RDU71628.1 ubiquinol cytochrome c oxidoreductase [Helicobacter aurati]